MQFWERVTCTPAGTHSDAHKSLRGRLIQRIIPVGDGSVVHIRGKKNVLCGMETEEASSSILKLFNCRGTATQVGSLGALSKR